MWVSYGACGAYILKSIAAVPDLFPNPAVSLPLHCGAASGAQQIPVPALFINDIARRVEADHLPRSPWPLVVEIDGPSSSNDETESLVRGRRSLAGPLAHTQVRSGCAQRDCSMCCSY